MDAARRLLADRSGAVGVTAAAVVAFLALVAAVAIDLGGLALHARRLQGAADLAALAPQKRGPKPDPAAAEARQIAQLMRENERLKSQLDKARLVIEVQKKVAALLGSPIDDTHDKS